MTTPEDITVAQGLLLLKQAHDSAAMVSAWMSLAALVWYGGLAIAAVWAVHRRLFRS